MYDNNVIKSLYDYVAESLNVKMAEERHREFASIIMDAEEEEHESEVNVVLLSYERQDNDIVYDINVYHTGNNASEVRDHMEVVSKLLNDYYTGSLCELKEGVLLQRDDTLPAQAIHKIIIRKPVMQC